MGGSARTWSVELPADLAPGGAYTLRLVMTNVNDGEPPLEIAYELAVVPAA